MIRPRNRPLFFGLALLSLTGCNKEGWQAFGDLMDTINEHNEQVERETLDDRRELLSRQERAVARARQEQRRLAAAETQLASIRARIDHEVAAEVDETLRKRAPLPPNTVLALVDIEHASVPDRARFVGAYLRLKIADDGRIRLVPRDTLREEGRRWAEISLSACHDDACQIEIGRAAAADKLLVPTVIDVGKTCVLTLLLYDLTTETAEWALTRKTGCAIDPLREVVDSAVAELRQPPWAEPPPREAATRLPAPPRPRVTPAHGAPGR